MGGGWSVSLPGSLWSDYLPQYDGGQEGIRTPRATARLIYERGLVRIVAWVALV